MLCYLYTTHELFLHRARWLGGPCAGGYAVVVSCRGLYTAGFSVWTCLAFGMGVALLV
jgi:hypothetical protein